MPTTMKLIAKTTLGSDAANIEFTSIPGTGYTDLVLLCHLRSDNGGSIDDVIVRFNGASTDTNLSARLLQNVGGGASSGTRSLGYVYSCPSASSTSNVFGSAEILVPNYAGSTNKSYSVSGNAENNAVGAYIDATAGLWSDTSAITSVKLLPRFGSNFVSGSSAFLYGITKA